MSSFPGEPCGCEYAHIKQTVWQTVIYYLDGCDVQMLVFVTGQPPDVVKWCLEELYIEEKVYCSKGRWYPEMGVS